MIEPGFYRHFNGETYEVKCVARDRYREYVIYCKAYTQAGAIPQYYARSVDEFEEDIFEAITEEEALTNRPSSHIERVIELNDELKSRREMFHEPSSTLKFEEAFDELVKYCIQTERE